MAVSEAKRASNAAWDKDNMAYQTVKVRREILAAFREACAERGDRVNTVLREAMEAYAAGTLQLRGAEGRAEPAPQHDGYELDGEDLERAKAAAEANGEELPAWLHRAISEQTERDRFLRMLQR